MKADIAIIGAGPAGLAAAAAALQCERAVVLIDDNPNIGGQIWRGNTPSREQSAILAHPRLRYLASTRVVAVPGSGQLLLESPGAAIHLRYARLIVASGARERLLPFPGWTLPGVTGAGGLQALVKNGMDVRGQRVVLAGTGPLLLAAAETLRHAGAHIAFVAEQAAALRLARFACSLLAFPTTLARAAELRWALRGLPYHAGSYVRAAIGDGRLRSVRLQSGAQSLELPCDWLGVGYGLVPNTELLQALGCALEGGHAQVDAQLRTSVSGIYAAGEATGIGGAAKAMLEGRIAGLVASGTEAGLDALIRQRRHQLRFVRSLARQFALRPEIAAQADANTIVCRCEDVRHGRLAKFDNWREAKLQTRCGMGACQGRLCADACATLYGWRGVGSRPPLQPARMGSLAGAATDTSGTHIEPNINTP